MASSSLLLRLASDEVLQTLEASSSSSSYDAFVPVFRPDPSGFSAASVVAAADRVRSQFLSVEPDLFHDALVAPGPDHLGFPEEGEEDCEESIRWDCLQLDDEDEPDLRIEASNGADEFDWEEVASPSGAELEQPEPEWEVLADVPPPAPVDAVADEGFVYTSDRDVYEVLVGDGLFVKNKPPAARSAIEALPSAVVAAGEEGEGEECAVCRDGVAAGERVKRLPCSHRYHEECIMPWLDVRNSCPLCRFELPTDDPQYETWKASRAAAA
ncbi:hypothetical protein E2562_009673 [Oryza meyeriana var. granulata]|uniref:RING-type E3 ubiquitin transferase n=1 Tax=Oryza meyeriana var. granulata TaxID=110450 RepID=A0A6G1D1T9_9ORYZ|nr:hypothetical protein E2562_009673 [Oryza meyeriana var. granulata]